MDNSFHMKPLDCSFPMWTFVTNPRYGISERILLCRIKGGPVVISSTTRNGFVILFDLGAAESFAAISNFNLLSEYFKLY